VLYLDLYNSVKSILLTAVVNFLKYCLRVNSNIRQITVGQFLVLLFSKRAKLGKYDQ